MRRASLRDCLWWVQALLINASPHELAAGFALNLTALNVHGAGATVRDVWARKNLGVGSSDGEFKLPAVAPFDSVFVRITPKEAE